MGKSILIIENDDDLREIYKEILELHGYDVITASNGAEGIKQFRKFRPALVVMEIDMPDEKGQDIFNQIKEIDKKSNVIIVTSNLEFKLKTQEDPNQGIIKVVLKPILVYELLKLTRKYTGIKPKKRLEETEDAIFELTIKTDEFLEKLNKKLMSS